MEPRELICELTDVPVEGAATVTCREFADFMMDYLSGEIAPESRIRFDDHLAHCSNCEKYLRGYEETVRLGKRAFEDERATLPDDVPQQLVDAILAARRKT
jgi:anti-sigma factor RsiW